MDMLEENKITKHNFGKLLQTIFKNNWEQIFIFDDICNTSLTYGDFFKRIIQIKEKILKLQIKKNENICVLMHNSVNLLALYIATSFLQITIIPIDPLRGKSEILDILSTTKPKILISNINDFNDFSNKIDLDGIESSNYQDDIIKNNLELFLEINFDYGFLTTFTSGSTGIPKGVTHSLNNLIKSSLAFNEKFNFNNERIFLHNLPMSYMAGILNSFVLPLVSCSKIVVSERFNISNALKFWDIPKKYSVNSFWFTPTILGLLLKFDRGEDGITYAHQYSLSGYVVTAPLNKNVKEEFQEKYKINLYESYGLSETLFVSTNTPSNNSKNVGELLSGVKLNFENDEIFINVPWMFLGYNEMSNNEFFKNDYFRSGDLGYLEKNILTITGRKKDLIIKGGMNLSPKKLEDFINNLKIFEESVILGIPDKFIGEKIVCFIIKNNHEKIQDYKKYVNSKITSDLGRDYHIDEFIELNEIPKTLNGKTDKIELRKKYEKKSS
jgi:long-chain acyl-CoA synthetase